MRLLFVKTFSHKVQSVIIRLSQTNAIIMTSYFSGVNKMEKIKLGKSFFKERWHVIALTLIAILSFWFNFYAISKTGYGNAYYAAAIKSMSQSFKNFFFVSFDPAGMVSVDKPPLALWIQVLFVKIFGYHGWAMLLPQALAGTGSCIMMYVLTAKYFGKPAGLISSLVFALTPAVVVASRNNTMDMQLIFVLLLATYFLFRSIEKSKWRYLFLAALFVGLGFNIKMMQAYMILPAVAVVYLIFAKEKIVKRIIAGLISLAIVAVVSFAWVIAVDLYPSNNRPYVDSSTNNTVLELIIGHNGLERLYGQGGGMGGGNKGQMPQMNGQNGTQGAMPNQNGTAAGTNTNNANTNGTQPMMPNGNNTGMANNNGNTNAAPPAMPNQNGNNTTANNNGNTNGTQGAMPNQNGNGTKGSMQKPSGMPNHGGQMGGGGITGNEIGNSGVFRLWTQSMYGQATWLFALALFCLIACVRKFSFKKLSLKQSVFLYWVMWLGIMYAFFSFAGFYHRYYLCMLAPGIAGLVGVGLVEMYKAFRDKCGWKQVLLPVSLIVTTVLNVIFVWNYTALRAWLLPLIIITAAAALILMAVHYIKPKKLALLAATGLMLVSVLAGPAYWSYTVVKYVPENVTMPYAGPELASTSKTPGMTPNQEAFTTGDSYTNSLEKYLVAHYKAGSYLVVSQSANDVAQFIIDTGLPAVAYGGFLGSDNSLSLSKLKELVKEGKITYFLVSGNSGRSSNSELISYVEKNATLVSPSEYSGTSSSTSSNSGTTSKTFSSSAMGNMSKSASLYCFK